MSSHHPVPIEQLLAHREWVRRVARAMVRDENDADDLEQGLWLDALQHPPRSGRSLRGWLFTALRRDRANARCSEASRVARQEATARAEAVPSAEELVANADAHKRVVDAVMDLDEPYRSTVLYRFFEDLPPSGIAEREGVPVETVRTRLKRAVAQLRARLDAEAGGDGRAWCLALAPLVRRPRAPATAVGTAAAIAAGALLMGTKVKAAAALLAVILFVGAALHVAGEDPGAAEPRTESSSAAGDVPSPKRRATADPTTVDESAPVRGAPGAVELTVRSWNGQPVAGATAAIRAVEAAEGSRVADIPASRAAAEATTDALGLARIEHLEVARDYRIVVRSDRRGCAARDFRLASASAPLRIDIVLVGECRVSGRVLDAAGAPVTGAVVLASTGGDLIAGRSVSGDDGRYTMGGLPYGTVALYAGREGAVFASTSIEARAAATSVRLPSAGDIDLVLCRSARISGVVRDAATGTPLAGAAVTLLASATQRSCGPAVTDSLGRYLLPGPCDAIVDSAVVRMGGYATAPTITGPTRQFPFLIRDGGALTLDLALEPRAAGAAAGGTIEGRVLGAGDAPIAGARVGPTSSGADGAFRIDGAPSGVEQIWDVAAAGFAQTELIATPPARGEVIRRDVRLAPAPRARGTVTTASGAPIPEGCSVRIQVLVERSGRASAELRRFLWAEAPVQADGTWECELPWAGPARYRATASAPGLLPAISDLVDLDPAVSEYRTDLVLAAAEPIRGRVVDATTGGPVAGAWILDGNVVSATTGTDGSFAFVGGGPGGTVRGASVDTRSHVRWHASMVEIWSPGDFIEVRLDPARSISGTVTWDDGTPVADAIVRTIPESGSTPTSAEGRFVVTRLDARKHVVAVEHPDAAREEIADVEADRSDLRIVLRRGSPILGRVLGADGAGVPGVWIIARPEDRGSPVLRTVTGADGGFVLSGAGAGVAFVANLVPPARPTDEVPDTGRYRRTTAWGLRAGGGPVDLRLDEGETIIGTLADEAGAPIAGVTLQAAPVPGGPERTATTGASGRFQLSGLHAAEYLIAPARGGGLSAVRGGDAVPGGARDVRLVGVRSVVLRGVVVDERQEPVRDALLVVPSAVKERRGPFPGSDGATARDGSFEVRDLDPATGVVYIDAQGFVPQQIDASRAGPEPLRVSLVRGHTVAGRVLRADGSGVRAAILFRHRTTTWLTRSVSTDADGRFRSTGFAEGVFETIVRVSPRENVATGDVIPSTGEEVTLRIP
ncbi:MAG: hypothetical protein HMLKMBBP_00078 [Planctomycetes bacterium]|nr:hypothetical protein [Planctomycetota bacterium]